MSFIREREGKEKYWYLYRALVLYNAVVAAANAAAVNPGQQLAQVPILPIRGQELAPLIYSPLERAVLALLGQNVLYVSRAITLE